DELDVGRDADGAEQPAADGAEEGLGELRVGERHDLCGELAANLLPQAAVGGVPPELEAQRGNGLVDVLVVQLDALDRIALAALPVARVEALRRTARDGTELRVVAGKGLDDVAGTLARGRDGGGIHAARVSRSRWGGMDRAGAGRAARSARRAPARSRAAAACAPERTRPHRFRRSRRGCRLRAPRGRKAYRICASPPGVGCGSYAPTRQH